MFKVCIDVKQRITARFRSLTMQNVTHITFLDFAARSKLFNLDCSTGLDDIAEKRSNQELMKSSVPFK
jgi:hypothetical protein